MRYIRITLQTILTVFLLNSYIAANVYDSIKAKTDAFFSHKLGLMPSQVEVVFNNIPGKLEQFSSADIKIVSQKRNPVAGRQTIWVHFVQNNKNLKKVPVNLQVDVIRKVVVASKQIKRGTSINPLSLILKTKRLGKDWNNYYFDLDDLNGLEAKRLIKKGTALTERMIRETQLVRSGQKVNVQLKAGPLTISTQATAKQSGAGGDSIKLQLEKTGKMIRGIVSSANLVVVYQE